MYSKQAYKPDLGQPPHENRCSRKEKKRTHTNRRKFDTASENEIKQTGTIPKNKLDTVSRKKQNNLTNAKEKESRSQEHRKLEDRKLNNRNKPDTASGHNTMSNKDS